MVKKYVHRQIEQLAVGQDTVNIVLKHPYTHPDYAIHLLVKGFPETSKYEIKEKTPKGFKLVYELQSPIAYPVEVVTYE